MFQVKIAIHLATPMSSFRFLSFFKALQVFAILFAGAGALHGTTVNVAAGDVPGLIAAMNNSQVSTINLSPSTYTLTAINNYWFGANGLPIVDRTLTINGNGAVLVRDNAAPAFRFFYVKGLAGNALGRLTLNSVELRNGLAQGGNGGGGANGGGGGAGMGGAIFNHGMVILLGCTLDGNLAHGGNGGDAVAGAASGGNGGGGGLYGAGGSVTTNSLGGGGGGGLGSNGAAPDVNTGAGGNGGGFLSTAESGGGAASSTEGVAGASSVGGNGAAASVTGGGGGGGYVTGADGVGTAGGGLGSDGGHLLGGNLNRFNDGGDGRTVINAGHSGGGGAVGGGGGAGYGALGGGGGGGTGAGGGGGGAGCGGGAGGFGGGAGGSSAVAATGGFGGGGSQGGVSSYGGGTGGGSNLTAGAGGGGGAGMGGAIFNHRSSLSVQNCTFTQNTATGGNGGAGTTAAGAGQGGAGMGAAIFNMDGTFASSPMEVIYSTLVGNTVTAGSNGAGSTASTASHDGAAICNVAYGQFTRLFNGNPLAESAEVQLEDSITAGSTGGNDLFADRIDVLGNCTSFIFINADNIVMTKGTSPLAALIDQGSISMDPQLGPLQNNGGPVPTMAPVTGSPAIDAGAAATLAVLSFDARGLTRSIGSAPDIGAVEIQPLVLSIVSGNNQNAPLDTQFPNPLTVQIEDQAGDPVSNVTLAFTSPSSGASGHFAAGVNSAITNVSGIATTPFFISNNIVGSYVVTAALSTTGAGLAIPVSFSLSNVIIPVVSSLDPVDPITTNDLTVHWTLVFSAPVTGVAAGNFTLSGTGSGSAQLGTPTTSDGGTTWHISATTGGGAGSLVLSLTSYAGITPTPSTDLPVAAAAYTLVDGAIASLTALQGTAVPGTGDPNGPPSDALLAAFGLPAIDDTGLVAYTASWASKLKGKGKGIFLGNDFLAFIGGTAPGSTAKYVTLSDPVIGDGSAAFLATLSGAPKGESFVIVAGSSKSSLQVVAQSGTAAPGTGSTLAKFASFKEIAVRGNDVAFLATLAPGTGNPKVTAATNTGIWIKSGSNAPVLALRKGQKLGNLTIQSLVSFTSGNGSPGQGRGWLTETSAGPSVQALIILSNKVQEVVRWNATDGLSIVSETGTTGAMGPGTTGGSGVGGNFASYGIPAGVDNGDASFLATLTVGSGTPPVTALTARGVWAAVSGGGFNALARIGGAAGNTGGTFSVLRDPVLASDGGVAFPATIVGKTVKGAAASTLWWLPAGTTTGTAGVQLLAQGGASTVTVPGSAAGAQWQSFPSLGIAANRGPIFTAKLVPGKGSVTAATASGLWAINSSGRLMQIVRTGVTTVPMDSNPAHDKMVKGFKVLAATPGNIGVTRSFNENGQIVWLATFSDKTQGVVVSELP